VYREDLIGLAPRPKAPSLRSSLRRGDSGPVSGGGAPGYKKGGSTGYAERNGAKASSLGVGPQAIRVDSGPLDVMS